MKKIIINVSGLTYETTDQCLERYPGTLLGDPEKRKNYFVHSQNIYFFDRHRLAFEGILMYYQCFGRVVCPEYVPDEIFEDELNFFLIECEYLRIARETKRFVISPITGHDNTDIQSRVWRIMENPQSSFGAQVLSAASLVMTVASVALACLFPGDNDDKQRMYRDIFPAEITCFAWFTIEYLTRLWSCPNKKKFLKSCIDITDLITLVVFYSSLALTSTEASSTNILKVFRLANAFRVFRLTRFSNGLQLLIYTIYKSKTDLQILFGFLAFFIMISGTLIYFAEANVEGSLFNDGGIFDGIWFSVISCTTVGYGDIVPVSLLGKVIASLTITFGAMFVLLPVLKLVSAFSDALKATRDLLSTNGEVQKQDAPNETK